MEKVLSTFERRFEQHLEDLKSLVRIPSVSFDGFDPANVRRSAEHVAVLMKKAGLENIEVLELPGAHPYVYGEHLKAPGKPTLLLYAHHDVQPPGREELWNSPPFEPTLREGPGGIRMYARGSADDKAAISAQLAAVAAYRKTGNQLPCNIKMLVEGEEEVGSKNFVPFLDAHKKDLAADFALVCDTGMWDPATPAITTSLRGLTGGNFTVKVLNEGVHSGDASGVIPSSFRLLRQLLSRIEDQDTGRILIDGQDIAGVTQKSLRAAIGMVPQDTVLFNDTIRYNIRYGRPDASDEEVEEAARLAQIHGFVQSLPKGYDSLVGERGLKLSGGEKQRVSIARTILKGPPILILDEATSALDSESERHVQAALEELMKGRTTIVIAHRLSTIEHCDRVVVLQQGGIIEQGTHAELIARDGVYAKLHRIQYTLQGDNA